MDETRDRQNGANLDRRKFLGALAGAAATGALLQRGGGAAKAQGPTAYYYEDSFGNILPCSPDTIAAGGFPPPLPRPKPPPAADTRPRRQPAGRAAPSASPSGLAPAAPPGRQPRFGLGLQRRPLSRRDHLRHGP